MNSSPHNSAVAHSLEAPDAASQRREDYWAIVIRQFRKNHIAIVGLILVLLLFGVALGADFLANDMPLAMRLVVLLCCQLWEIFCSLLAVYPIICRIL